MAELPFDEAVARLRENESRFDDFINDAVEYITREGVSVESLIAFLDRLETEITGYANLSPRVDTLETEMNAVESDVADFTEITNQIDVTASGDDKGLIIKEQLSVGKPEAGRETVLGEGDSYPVVRAWHVDTANIVGMNAVSATEITTDLQSEDLSTIGLFGSALTGKTLLLMSDLAPFTGIKAKIDTLGTVEPASLAIEYLEDNTPTWTSLFWMATKSDFPYTQRANVLGSVADSEQWRFTNSADGSALSWDEVTMNVNGSDYTGYFLRIRTISAITLDPVIEQLKLHTNRFECNSDGATEFFGRARYPKDLHIESFENSAKAPLDENIAVASGVTIVATNNEFTAAAADGNVYLFTVPSGLDTSIPIIVEKRFYPGGNGSGDIKYDCDVYKVEEGTVLDGTLAASDTLSNLVSVATQQDELIKTTFTFYIDDLVPGDTVVLDIHRDGGDASDTFVSNIVDVSGRAVGHFWKP